MYKLTDDGSANAGYVYGDITVPDDAETEGLCVSWIYQEGTAGYKGFFQIYDGGTRIAFGDCDPAIYCGSLPMRFIVRLPPGEYGATLTFYMTVSNGKASAVTTYQYIGDLMANVGREPAKYTQTTGTAHGRVSAAETSAIEGIPRSMFDLGCLCFSNDGGWVNNLANEIALSSAVDSMLTFCKRVMILTPPPMSSNAGAASVWLTGTDDARVTPNDWFGVMKRVAQAHNCFFYDCWTGAQALTSSGAYTVNDLMQDAVHPTVTALEQLYAPAIADVLNATVDRVPVKRGNGGCCRITGTRVGTWAETVAALANYEIEFAAVGSSVSGGVYWQSTTANDTYTFTVTGKQIAVLYVLGGSAGVVDVTVDAEAAVRLSFGAQVNKEIRTMRLTDANGPILYGPGSHTVEVKVVSGEVKLQGVVGFGG